MLNADEMAFFLNLESRNYVNLNLPFRKNNLRIFSLKKNHGRLFGNSSGESEGSILSL